MVRQASYSKPLWSQLYLPQSEARNIAVQALDTSYAGGSLTRRTMSEWRPTTTDADAATLADIQTLRNRVRDLIRNNPLANGALNTNVTSIVGTGLMLQSEPDRDGLGMSEEQARTWSQTAEREWRLYTETNEIDLARRCNFMALQELCFLSGLEAGDVFLQRVWYPRGDHPYATKWQPIEADRISNPNDDLDTQTLVAGIQRSATTGEPVRYHVRVSHPGAQALDANLYRWTSVPAYDEQGRPNMLHIMRPGRIGQTRGVPYLTPVIEPLKQLGRYTEAELAAAVVAGYLTVFIRTESGQAEIESMLPDHAAATTTKEARTSDDVKLGNAAVVGLAEGESIDTVNPQRPNAGFDPFVLAILRQIGVGLELPYEILIKHFDSSYSASRAAMLEAWRYFLTRRRWFSQVLCQPIYEAFLEEAVARGRLQAPGFLSDAAIRHAYCQTRWIGPAPGQIDEEKAVSAAEKRLSLGLTTMAEEAVALTGSDWDTKLPRLRFERDRKEELGLNPEQQEPNAQPQDGQRVADAKGRIYVYTDAEGWQREAAA